MINIMKISEFYNKKDVVKDVDIENNEKIYSISINDIKPNPNQVRRFFKRDSLDELTTSVKKFGVCQPILVRYINNKFYELISGERRLMAAKAAGLDKIPAIVLSVSDSRSAVLSIVENTQRQCLNFIEEAEGYFNLKSDYGFSEDEIASLFGLRINEVNKKLRFMNFTSECRAIIAERGITQEHAEIVLKIPDNAIRKSVLIKIYENNLNIQKTSELVESEIEKIKAEDTLFSEQKEKRNFTDMRLLTNTVKRSVELMNRSGIGAEYEVESLDEATKIIISIPKD